MPEGLDIQPGHAPGHPSASTAPNVYLVEVHLEEGASGAWLCHAALTATTRAEGLG